MPKTLRCVENEGDMNAKLWTTALLLAVVMGILLSAAPARAAPEDPETTAKRKELVWNTQLKYAEIGGVCLVLSLGACWALSKANQTKKKYADDLKKQDRLDPNEGMDMH